MPKIPKSVSSDFVILDVKRGRHALSKCMPAGSAGLAAQDRIPVVIYGFISHQWGCDDGISIEFGVDVERVVLTDPKPA
ncbi:MAG: hypothetical protein IPO08_18510 [Xanthomonadales bacterium]|nr:hypothetical protein [Xanthomonadales bacterium]